jgi:hypothetical protein
LFVGFYWIIQSLFFLFQKIEYIWKGFTKHRQGWWLLRRKRWCCR